MIQKQNSQKNIPINELKRKKKKKQKKEITIIIIIILLNAYMRFF